MPHGGSVDYIYPCKNASLNTSMPLPMSGSYPREPLFFFSETIKVGIFDMEAVSKPHTFSENQEQCKIICDGLLYVSPEWKAG